ncbi:cytochrome P450 [Hyalangium minutum]|uniref:Cytochrome P450 n=1 Tax=Hyalangium minutum TaxID=394096 RepID=A0A085WWD4_9BACT|nr:cytochrome P450 [Hyalangium minutum]KFE71997.1 cytochrome P450 [Hyalangium minutum]
MTQQSATASLPLRPNQRLGHIPGVSGVPFLGDTLEFLKDPVHYKLRMHERFGPVFRTSILGDRSLILVGPELAEEVLLDKERNFSSQYGWHRLIGDTFKNGLMLRDFDDHHTHRRIMNAAFKPEPMRAYVEALNRHIEQGIASWHRQPDFRFYPAVKALTLTSSAKTFLGLDLASEMDTLNKAFMAMLDGATALLRYPVPGTRTWYAQRGRRTLEDFFRSLIPQRRQGNGTDLFSQCCRATSEEGEVFSDTDLVDHMIFLLMASHDTTTSVLSNVAFGLANHPEWQERIRAQVMALGNELSYDELGSLSDADLVMKEVLRLYPPVIGLPRRVIRECTLVGLQIPANTNIWVSVDANHRLPKWWKDPETFDPGRFSTERAEHQQHRFLWMPFGGGAHRCIGMKFAELNVKAYLFQLLRRYRLKLRDGYVPLVDKFPFPKPAEGLPMKLELLEGEPRRAASA